MSGGVNHSTWGPLCTFNHDGLLAALTSRTVFFMGTHGSHGTCPLDGEGHSWFRDCQNSVNQIWPPEVSSQLGQTAAYPRYSFVAIAACYTGDTNEFQLAFGAQSWLGWVGGYQMCPDSRDFVKLVWDWLGAAKSVGEAVTNAYAEKPAVIPYDGVNAGWQVYGDPYWKVYCAYPAV